MNAKRFSWLFLALLLLLAACGGNEPDPTATPEPLPTATDVPPTATPVPPTATPVPPTATPEPTAAPDLTADFVDFESAEAGHSFKHPADWAVQGFFGLNFVASDVALLDAPDEVTEGAVLIAIGSPIAELGEGIDTPLKALTFAQDNFGEGFGEDLTIVDGPTATTVNDQEAATIRLTGASESGIQLTVIMTVIFNGDQAAILVAATPIDQTVDYIPVLEAIISTVEVFPPTAATLPNFGIEGVTLEGTLFVGDTVEGTVVSGEKSGWDFIGTGGTAVDIIVVPSGDLDAVVDVVDQTGTSILTAGEIDAEFGTEEILGVEIPADGFYTVVVRGFAGGGGDYTLTVTKAGSGGLAVGTSGGVLVYGQTGKGTLAANETATWTFDAQELDVVDVLATTISGDLDLVMDVVDSTGTSILDDGELDESFSQEKAYLVIIPEDGTYTVVLKPYGAAGGDYEVTVTAANNGGPGSILFASDELEADEAHAFPFTAYKGATVRAVVEPADDLDVVLYLYNNTTGEEIDSVDFSFGIEEYTFVVPADDDYYFEVVAYDSTATGAYDVLLVGDENVFFELAYGDFIVGRLGEAGFLDYFFALGAGEDFIIEANAYNEELDLVIQILDLEGNLLQEVDEFLPGGSETLQYVFPAEGMVIIRIIGLDSTGGFNFEIQ